jgi:hypothetical protein
MSFGDGSEVSMRRSQAAPEPPFTERKFKLQWLPIGVDRNVAHLANRDIMQGERDTVGIVSPVRLAKFNSVPFDSGLAEIVFQSDLTHSRFPD